MNKYQAGLPDVDKIAAGVPAQCVGTDQIGGTSPLGILSQPLASMYVPLMPTDDAEMQALCACIHLIEQGSFGKGPYGLNEQQKARIVSYLIGRFPWPTA